MPARAPEHSAEHERSPDFDEFIADCLKFQDELYRRALMFTRNETAAQDLLQEVYIKVIRHESHFKRGTNLRAWLYTILQNTFVNIYRRGRRVDIQPQDPAILEATYDGGGERVVDGAEAEINHKIELIIQEVREVFIFFTDPEIRGDLKLTLDEMHYVVMRLLRNRYPKKYLEAFLKLPKERAVTLVLVDILEFSYQEAADIVGCPRGTVMTRLFHGRRILAKDSSLSKLASDQGIADKNNGERDFKPGKIRKKRRK